MSTEQSSVEQSSQQTTPAKSQYSWNKHCDGPLNTYELIFTETFPDKSWSDDDALTPAEVELVIENIKDYANATIKCAINLATDDYSSSLEKIQSAAMIKIGEAPAGVVKDGTPADVPIVDATARDATSTTVRNSPTQVSNRWCDWIPKTHEERHTWFKTLNETFPSAICSFIVHCKEYDLLHHAKNTGYKCGENVYYQLAYMGDVEGLKWFLASGEVCVWMVKEIRQIAASKGHLNVIEWTHKQFTCEKYEAWPEAAENGHYDIVKWYAARRQ